MAGEVRIPIGLNTDTALQDAKKLEADVKRTLSKVDMGTANSKTLTFVKNLTSAYNRMQKLADEAQRLSNTKLPTEDYAYYNKQLEKALSSLTKLQAKQDQIEQDRNTIHAREKSIAVDIENAEARLQAARTRNDLNAVEEADHLIKQLKAEQMSLPAEVRRLDDAWTRVNGRIEQLSPVITDLQSQLNQLVEQNEAFTSGRDSQAYREKAEALNIQNQALTILLLRYAEMNDASIQNIQDLNQETNAIKQQTQATQDLSQARRELSNGRGGVVRGPQLHHRRGISRGPALDTVDDVKFSRQGETVAELSRYAQAENEVAESTDRATESTQRSTNAMRSYGSVLGEVGRTVLARMRGALNRLVNAFRQLSHHLHSSHRNHNNLMGNMKHSLSMILRYTLGIRSLFMLVRRIRSYTKEAFKVMAQEIPEVNENISRLGHSFKELKAGFGTMFQPILKALTPLLDNILQKIVSMMNAVGKFFATLSGQDYVYEATVANYDYAESVKEAEGALASFDKLNVISKSKNDLSLTTDTVTYKKVKINPEDKWYTQLAKDIKEGWEKADLSDATHGIAEKLASWLDSIKWEDIEAKSTKFAHTLATGINGITLPDEDTGRSHLADSIGKTIASALQTAINTFDTFITDIDWDNLANCISNFIETLKTQLREKQVWERVGAAFGHLFQNLITLGFKLFVEDNVLEGLGDDLSHLLNAFLDEGFKINPKTKRTYFEDFGEIVTTGIIEFLEEIEKFLEGSAGKLGKAINKFMQGARLKDLFLTLARVLIKGIFYGISLLIQGAAGALGIDISDSTALFFAEALGITALGIKIGRLVGCITGGGGLLSAFSRKDRALGNQRRALGLETVAATVLAGVLVKNLLSGTEKVTEGVQGLAGTTAGLAGVTASTTTEVDGLATSLTNVATEGENACNRLEEATTNTLTNVETQFEQTHLKLNEVDTSAYNNAIAVTQQTISTLENMWANAKLKAPAPEYETPSETQPNPNNVRILKTTKDPDKQFLNAPEVTVVVEDKTEKKEHKEYQTTPLYELQQQSIKATAELQNSVVDLEKYFGEHLEVLYQLYNDANPTKAGSAITFSKGDEPTKYDIWKESLISEYNKLPANEAQQFVDALSSLLDNYYNPADSSSTKSYLESLTTGLQNLLKWLPFALGSSMSIPIPYGAAGMVIPPNQPFLAMVGDQKNGTNVETPLSTIKQAVAEVLANMQIKNTFNVKGDPNSIFRVVLDETKIFYNQHGYSPFPSET